MCIYVCVCMCVHVYVCACGCACMCVVNVMCVCVNPKMEEQMKGWITATWGLSLNSAHFANFWSPATQADVHRTLAKHALEAVGPTAWAPLLS